MKITRKELHRRIAQRLETSHPFNTNKVPDGSLSKLGFWKLALIGPDLQCGMIPVNFSVSEDASARLLDAMREAAFNGDVKAADALALYGSADIFSAPQKDRKAWLLKRAQHWLGIEGELEDSNV